MTSRSVSRGIVTSDFTWTPELKQKVADVSDVMLVQVPKENIAAVLQYYDFDVDMAINAFNQDGGAEALSSWKSSGNKLTKNNKNKKKSKKKSKKENVQVNITVNTDAEDSSSIHSSNIDTDCERYLSSKADDCIEKNDLINNIDENLHDHDEADIDVKTFIVHAVCNSEEESRGIEEDEEFKHSLVNEVTRANDVDASRNASSEYKLVNECTSNLETKSAADFKEEKFKSYKDFNHLSKHKQRHNSSHSKSNTSYNNQGAQVSTSIKKGGFDRCRKDLTRQTIFLQRIKNQLETGLGESSRRLKSTFTEVRKMLDRRQAEIEKEMERTRSEALELLKSRQDLAANLKIKVDRMPSLNEVELNELRSDIKQFVTERKYDEELGKTIWFHWSMDNITEAINKLGEVQPVKSNFSQRSHNIDEQSKCDPSAQTSEGNSSIDNQENSVEQSADSNDTSTVKCTEFATSSEKDFAQTKNPGQFETRSRVFSNRFYPQSNFSSRYQVNANNRGRGFFRGRNPSGRAPGNFRYDKYRQPNNRNDRMYFDSKQPYVHPGAKMQKSDETKDSYSDDVKSSRNVNESVLQESIAHNYEAKKYSYYQHQSYNNRGYRKNFKFNSENVSHKFESAADMNSNCNDPKSEIDNAVKLGSELDQ